MLRSLIHIALLGAVCAGVGHGAIWTEEFFGFERTELSSVTLPDEPIWREYGFEEGERAVYSGEGRTFTVTAWRFNDATSAMAVYQWQRPMSYRPSPITSTAVETDDNLYIASGNYVIHFEGYKPTFEQLQGMFLVLPMSERSSLPTLPDYLPKEGLIPGSERFVIGPAGLDLFEPRIPLSVAAFQFSAEAQLGSYYSDAGKLDLAILSYPTPTIARERLAEFRMLPNMLVKRTGPMLVVAIDPPDQEEAQRILGRVEYRATITWDEFLPEQQVTIGQLILTAALLVGLLAIFAVIGGLGVAGLRMLQQRSVAGTPAEDPMILLHLEDKS